MTTPTQTDDEWSCSVCTYLNKQLVDKCDICSSKRHKKAAIYQKTTKPSSRGATKPLFPVGSPPGVESEKISKKVKQLQELGINLCHEDLVSLLARNCYSVHAAASEFFEKPTSGTTQNEEKFQKSTNYFETNFATDGFHLIGKELAEAYTSRSGLKLERGQQMHLQAEDAGKKRSRSPASSLSAGVIRVSSFNQMQVCIPYVLLGSKLSPVSLHLIS
jgi:hypothetical protein